MRKNVTLVLLLIYACPKQLEKAGKFPLGLEK